MPNLYAEQQECDHNAGSAGPGLTKTASHTVVQRGAAGKYATVGRRTKRGREACQGQAKEKDGPEDGGESRNTKCGHYDWQREIVG